MSKEMGSDPTPTTLTDMAGERDNSYHIKPNKFVRMLAGLNKSPDNPRPGQSSILMKEERRVLNLMDEEPRQAFSEFLNSESFVDLFWVTHRTINTLRRNGREHEAQALIGKHLLGKVFEEVATNFRRRWLLDDEALLSPEDISQLYTLLFKTKQLKDQGVKKPDNLLFRLKGETLFLEEAYEYTLQDIKNIENKINQSKYFESRQMLQDLILDRNQEWRKFLVHFIKERNPHFSSTIHNVAANPSLFQLYYGVPERYKYPIPADLQDSVSHLPISTFQVKQFVNVIIDSA